MEAALQYLDRPGNLRKSARASRQAITGWRTGLPVDELPPSRQVDRGWQHAVLCSQTRIWYAWNGLEEQVSADLS